MKTILCILIMAFTCLAFEPMNVHSGLGKITSVNWTNNTATVSITTDVYYSQATFDAHYVYTGSTATYGSLTNRYVGRFDSLTSTFTRSLSQNPVSKKYYVPIGAVTVSFISKYSYKLNSGSTPTPVTYSYSRSAPFICYDSLVNTSSIEVSRQPVSMASNQPERVYDISGRLVKNPTRPGVYMVRQGLIVRKLVIH